MSWVNRSMRFLISALMLIIFLMVLGFFAGGIGTWLEERKQAAGKIRIGSGTVLVLLVFRMLLPTKIECPMSQ